MAKPAPLRMKLAKEFIAQEIKKHGFKKLVPDSKLRHRIIEQAVTLHDLDQTTPDYERHFRLFAASALMGGERTFFAAAGKSPKKTAVKVKRTGHKSSK